MFRPSTLFAIAMLAGALAAGPALAQSVPQEVHGAAKATGRGIKAGAKSVGSSVHHVLKTAGRGTKSALARAVGDTIHHPNHKPGGLNKVARDLSESIKHVGRSAKAGVHEEASDAHKTLQKNGKDVKKDVAGKSHHS